MDCEDLAVDEDCEILIAKHDSHRNLVDPSARKFVACEDPAVEEDYKRLIAKHDSHRNLVDPSARKFVEEKNKEKQYKEIVETKKGAINVKGICDINVKGICNFYNKKHLIKMKYVPNVEKQHNINFGEGRVYNQGGHAYGAFLLKKKNKNYCIVIDPRQSHAQEEVLFDIKNSPHTKGIDPDKDMTFIVLKRGLQHDNKNCITYALKLVEMFARNEAKIANSLVEYYEANQKSFEKEAVVNEVVNKDGNKERIFLFNACVLPIEKGRKKGESAEPTELFANWEYAGEIGKLSHSKNFHKVLASKKNINVFYKEKKEGQKNKTKKTIPMEEYTKKFIRDKEGKRIVARINMFREKYIKKSNSLKKSNSTNVFSSSTDKFRKKYIEENKPLENNKPLTSKVEKDPNIWISHT